MSEERPQHPQEPAEGAEDAEEAPGFDRAGDDDGEMQEEDDEQRSVEHPQEPAEGGRRGRGSPGGRASRRRPLESSKRSCPGPIREGRTCGR